MTVDRFMTRDPITVHGETTVPEARSILKANKISRLPVTDKGKALIGIVTEFDLVNACPSSATSLDMWEVSYLISKLKVESIMTKKVVAITESCTVEDAARLMADHDISGLPVMRGENIVGIITESDLFRVFVELFGARKRGTRATLLLPDKLGEIAALTASIAEAGGNIISLNTYPADTEAEVICTMKVEGLSKETFISAILKDIDGVIDVREA
jgi:acetoin utilization protein AcuB